MVIPDRTEHGPLQTDDHAEGTKRELAWSLRSTASAIQQISKYALPGDAAWRRESCRASMNNTLFEERKSILGFEETRRRKRGQVIRSADLADGRLIARYE